MTKDLKQIISEAYTLFAKYPAPKDLDVCTDCCVTPNEADALMSMSVQHIPFKLLYTYNTAAKTANPSITEFKHYLPRFLDLLAQNQYVSHSTELTLSRFEYYTIEQWEEGERDLMQRFANAFMQQCMQQYPIPEYDAIDSILIMLWKAKVDIQELLQQWLVANTPESVVHYKDLVMHAFKSKKPNMLSSGFADTEVSTLLADWREKFETKKHFQHGIERIILQPPKAFDNDMLNELSWVYEHVKLEYL